MATMVHSTSEHGDRPRLLDADRCGVMVQRMRAEFLEMPGMVLTLRQAARLWSLRPAQARLALRELIRGGFLMRDLRGAYRRRGVCPRCS